MKNAQKTILTFIILFICSILFSCDRDPPENEVRVNTINQAEIKHSPTDIRQYMIELYNKSSISNRLADANDFDIYRPFLTLTLNGNMLEPNKLGRKIYSELYFIYDAGGGLFMLKFYELTDKKMFDKVKTIYTEGGFIEVLGFAKGLGVPESNPKIFIPGETLGQSYLIETLGAQKYAPSGFDSWKDSYIGKGLYRIFTVDAATGKEGVAIGWMVDVVRKSVTLEGNEVKHLILKKLIIGKEYKRALPEYIVSFPDGLIKDSSGEYQYKGQVLDANAQPKTSGLFLRLAAGSSYQCVNTTYGCRGY